MDSGIPSMDFKMKHKLWSLLLYLELFNFISLKKKTQKKQQAEKKNSLFPPELVRSDQ